MKKKEFEGIWKQLLSSLPHFAVKGSMAFLEPVGHTLRAIDFDQSIDPRAFYVHVLLEPLFVPTKLIGFNIGWRVGGGCHTWNADAPDLVPTLSAALQDEAVPFLTRIHSPRDTVDAAMSLNKSGDTYVQQAIAYALARAGDVEPAANRLEQLAEGLDCEVAWQAEMAARALALRKLLLTDVSAAQRQLLAWEEESVRNLGLEKYR